MTPAKSFVLKSHLGKFRFAFLPLKAKVNSQVACCEVVSRLEIWPEAWGTTA